MAQNKPTGENTRPINVILKYRVEDADSRGFSCGNVLMTVNRKINMPADIAIRVRKSESDPRIVDLIPDAATREYYVVAAHLLQWHEGIRGDFALYNEHIILCSDADASCFFALQDDRGGYACGKVGDGVPMNTHESLMEAMWFIDNQ